jgi:hypothetical protein
LEFNLLFSNFKVEIFEFYWMLNKESYYHWLPKLAAQKLQLFNVMHIGIEEIRTSDCALELKILCFKKRPAFSIKFCLQIIELIELKFMTQNKETASAKFTCPDTGLPQTNSESWQKLDYFKNLLTALR